MQFTGHGPGSSDTLLRGVDGKCPTLFGHYNADASNYAVLILIWTGEINANCHSTLENSTIPVKNQNDIANNVGTTIANYSSARKHPQKA